MKVVGLMALAVLGLFLVGSVALWLLKAVIGVLGYVIVGALVIGGGLFLVTRARKTLSGERQLRLPR